MAKEKGNNRYTSAASSEDKVNQFNQDELILKIMLDEFPDDRFYSKGTLGQESPVLQARKSFESKDKTSQHFQQAERNQNNVLDVTAQKDQYTRYDLAKAFPTIEDDELDDLLDEEWEYFEDPDEPESEPIVITIDPAPTGLFLVNSETDLTDFHDLYINGGPHNIEEDDINITDRIFCVFFVDNGVAYAIPTYKTLEVMLVERGLTYKGIEEATSEQIKDFDLLIDGTVDEDSVDYGGANLDADGDGDVTPLEEFRARSYPVRDSDWNYSIRFRSGYLPKAPFIRDPGDYIKPESARSVDGRQGVDSDGNILTDIWVKEDPEDRYFDRVFQKATYRERLRQQFEGKMIIADWPPNEYSSDEVTQQTAIKSDDAVLNLRMMINGHWKFVNNGAVMKLYAYLNDYDIADYSPINAGRYGPTGYIQLLVEAGGVKIIQAAGGTEDDDPDYANVAQTGNNDITSKNEILWNAFPHIVDADDDGIKGVDSAEYQEYLDNFSNGGEPFAIDYLLPYEPPGSIKYYPQAQYQALVAQGIEQEQIDAVKEQIYEIWPGIASLIQNTKIQFDALPADYSSYVVKMLGDKGPLYKLMMSTSGNWKYIKKKTWPGKDKIRTKTSERRLFKVCNRKIGIRMSLNEGQERDLVKNYKWMKTVQRDKFAAWMSGGAAAGIASAPVAAGAGVALALSIKGAALAASTLAFEASIASSLLPAISVSAAAPSLGAFIGTMATNPITLGVAALVGVFFIADALIGEVPNDRYDLPPWRFMDDNWYLKACIYNEIDDTLEGFKLAADAADTNMPWVAEMVDNMHAGMGEVDNAILKAMTAEEFEEIFAYLLTVQNMCEELNDSGLYALGVDLRREIDAYLKNQLKRQYNAIQYLRKRVYFKSMWFKRSKKYGIVWPRGPQSILNTYVPGCKFDNYIPKV